MSPEMTALSTRTPASTRPEGKDLRVQHRLVRLPYFSKPEDLQLPGCRDRSGGGERRRLIRDSDNMGWVEQQPADRQADM